MYRVDFVEGVPEQQRLSIVRREMKKPTYVGHHEYPEDGGGWTIVFVYRR